MWRGRRCGRASSWSARRWSSCGTSAPRAAATRSCFRGSQRSGSEQILKYGPIDWNRLRVCRSALVETWPMLGLIFNWLTSNLWVPQKSVFNCICQNVSRLDWRISQQGATPLLLFPPIVTVMVISPKIVTLIWTILCTVRDIWQIFTQRKILRRS